MSAFDERREALKRRGKLPEPVRRKEATQAALDKFKGLPFDWSEDLRDGRGEGGGLATAVPAAVSALDGAVDLRGRLDEQEEAAAHQDDVAPGYFQVEDLEQRRGQLGEPHQAGEPRQAADHREAEATQLGDYAPVSRHPHRV